MKSDRFDCALEVADRLLADEPVPVGPLTGWMRIAPAAKMAGLSVEMLAAGCISGKIPVALLQIGPRLRFVHIGQLYAWLKIEPNLCTPEELAAARRLPRYSVKSVGIQIDD